MCREKGLVEKCIDKGFDGAQLNRFMIKHDLEFPRNWNKSIGDVTLKIEMAHSEIDHTRHYDTLNRFR